MSDRLVYMSEGEFVAAVARPLGWYYLAAAVLNLGAVWYAVRKRRRRLEAGLWLLLAVGFGFLAAVSWAGRPLVLPAAFKDACDRCLSPMSFTLGAAGALVVFYLGRRLFVRPLFAWSVLNASLLFMGASLTDPEFAATVSKPDNVPIVGMVYLLAFFTWLGTAQAVRNDDRLRRGEKPVEAEYLDKVLVWPDVVYVELIGAILATVALVVWAMWIPAPLEEPANPAITPNPSKAPWYFVGLQEMLLYFDPAIAGVVIPTLIILGLMAVPYLDPNPRGSGYYTIDQRRFAWLVFVFGFLGLWIVLILIGTFMRGPNWSFFGLYEPRDPHKTVAATNVKLSEYFWAVWLERAMPQMGPESRGLEKLGIVLWREAPGLVLLFAYFLVLPAILARTACRRLRQAMGCVRYWITMLLLLMMFALPVKMLLNWTVHLSYIVSMPEYNFNF